MEDQKKQSNEFLARRKAEEKILFKECKSLGVTDMKLDRFEWHSSTIKLKNCWPLKKPRAKRACKAKRPEEPDEPEKIILSIVNLYEI
jgi:hypothetical protein